jgi:hypothetical protein
MNEITGNTSPRPSPKERVERQALGELPNQGFANMEHDEGSETSPRPSPKERVERQTMGARTYNPALGRFMSVNPLFEAFIGM